MYEIMKALHDLDYDGYIRPDDGRNIWAKMAALAMVYTIVL